MTANKQLKKSGHYTTSFFAALRTTFCVRTDYRHDRISRVPFFEQALFLPFIGLFIGFLLMVIAMISSYVFQSNVIASAFVVVGFICLFRGFFNNQRLQISWFDVTLLLFLFSLAYTAFARRVFLPLLLSVGVGTLTTLFAVGLGKDLPMAPKSRCLCGTFRNEDYFFIAFSIISCAIASIVVLHETWYYGLIFSLFIAAGVPHFIASHEGGVTSKGVSRGILLATVLSFAVLLIL